MSKDPEGLLPSTNQAEPAIAYSPAANHALVAWQDRGHYDDSGNWGVWGRIWMPTERVFLPRITRGAP